MSVKKSNKSNWFSGKSALILVFLAGIVLGGIGVYFFMVIPNRPVEQTIADNEVQNFDDLDINDTTEIIYQPDTNIVLPDTVPDSVAYEQIWNSLIAEPGYREMDSLFLDSLVKQIYADSVMQIHRETYDIYLQNEELLSAKYVSVDVLGLANDSTEQYMVSSSIRYYVEFWKSPVNFEGYVKTGKSIKLYSVQPGEPIVFASLNSDVYLLRQNKWFVLSDTPSEQSFISVQDTGILNILAEVI